MRTKIFDLKENMKGKYTNFTVKLARKKEKRETKKHMYKFKQLSNNKRNNIKYNEIFKSNKQKIKQVIQKINLNLLKRNSIMKKVFKFPFSGPCD